MLGAVRLKRIDLRTRASRFKYCCNFCFPRRCSKFARKFRRILRAIAFFTLCINWHAYKQFVPVRNILSGGRLSVIFLYVNAG